MKPWNTTFIHITPLTAERVTDLVDELREKYPHLEWMEAVIPRRFTAEVKGWGGWCLVVSPTVPPRQWTAEIHSEDMRGEFGPVAMKRGETPLEAVRTLFGALTQAHDAHLAIISAGVGVDG